MTDLGLRPVINAAGTMTVLGASPVPDEIIAAAAAILPKCVEMDALLDAASEAIAHATGAEAGHMTACAAAAITLSVAATMTGTDLALTERLPDCAQLPNEVVLLKGHNCHFSGEIGQMVRLSGARLVEVGTVNRATEALLRGSLSERTTAALYVVSHQTAQVGMIDLPTFAKICHDAHVPVIVDAAAEYDLRGFLASGADLVLYSAHKFLGGLTGGIIAGHADLVAACRLQDQGIGRTMKIGKEGIAGVIAALDRWQRLDRTAIEQEQMQRVQNAAQRLTPLAGLQVTLEADPTGNPVTRVRLKIDAGQTGLVAAELSRRLIADTPAIYVRDHDSDPKSLLLDPCNLSDDEMAFICDRIEHHVNRGDIDRARPVPLAVAE
ncbi:MAG: aminotransferase class V-fold PLP-dependent enzyme [Alphaproteobacteria bacterium]